jgi:hypothetical protein
MRDGRALRDSAILDYVTLCTLAACILKFVKEKLPATYQTHCASTNEVQ